jgi:hypothetical protein
MLAVRRRNYVRRADDLPDLRGMEVASVPRVMNGEES